MHERPYVCSMHVRTQACTHAHSRLITFNKAKPTKFVHHLKISNKLTINFADYEYEIQHNSTVIINKQLLLTKVYSEDLAYHVVIHAVPGTSCSHDVTVIVTRAGAMSFMYKNTIQLVEQGTRLTCDTHVGTDVQLLWKDDMARYLASSHTITT